LNDKQLAHRWFSAPLLGLLLALLAVGVALAAVGNIDVTHKWAWGANVGWVNFAPDNGGVTVYSDHLEGYAWGENIGWIRLGAYSGGGSHTYTNADQSTYGVNNDGAGNLSGYAWGTSVGWINFAPVNGGVTIDPITGDFDGYAWSENVGWIHFENDSPAYKVNTVWRGGPPVCFATGDDGATVFATANAHAVQQAVDAASPGGTVKVAGACVGVESRAGTDQSTYISKTLTLSGGYTTINWTASQPLTQPTVIDAAGGGRVIFATQNLTVTALTLQNGNAAGAGGGLLAGAALVMSRVDVFSNTATGANGGGVFATDGVIVTGGIFRANRCTGACSGGGLGSDSGPLVVTGAHFIDNTAGENGGGVYGAASLALTGATFVGNVAALGVGGGMWHSGASSEIVNSTFAGNSAGSYGGGAFFSGNTSLVDTAFTGNTASEGGGAEFDGAAALTATTFISNSAALGGGALFYNAYPRQVVNSLFAANTATMSGTAVYVYDAAPLTLIHTTMTSPTLAANGAVSVVDGAVYLTNTIIASHTVGIVLVGGAATEDYTLFDGVTTPRSGAVQVGSHSFTGAAAFFDTTGYTLTAASAAINRGVDAGVAADFAGESRPQAGGFDIGYDESPFPSQYELTVSKSGAGGGVVGSVPPGIDCGGDCGEAYPYGAVVTLTVTADTGSTFTGWSGACTGSGACVVTMNGTKIVTANFSLNSYALTTATAGAGSGAVTLSPAGGTYSHGTVVTVTNMPAAGSTFTGWSGTCMGSGACVVTMNGSKIVTATFTLNTYILTTATAGAGGGAVTLSPAGGTYSHGTVVTVTNMPAAGSIFTGWSGACTGSDACVVTMNGTKSVTATFSLGSFAVLVQPANSLTTSEAGASATFTVALTAQPTAPVTVTLVSSDVSEGTVSPTQMIFTRADWSTPQVATVTGVDDDVDDGNIVYIIVTTVSSGDQNYSGLAAADVSVTNTDDDGAATVYNYLPLILK
jgi:hypothetical protein